MKTLDEIALEVLKEMPIAPNGTGFMGWCAEYARRYRERLAQQEPVAWVLWNTVDDEPVMLYGDKPERTDFKKHFELRPLGFYAAPVLAPGMVQVPEEAVTSLTEAREQLFDVSGSAFLAGEKCKEGDGYACYQMVCAANNSIAYALELLAAAKEKAK